MALEPMPSSRLLATAAALALCTLLLFIGGLSRIGLTWDEPLYFSSAVHIQDWVRALVRGPDRVALLGADHIRQVWDWAHYWNPHPPVYKEAMALTEALTGRWLGWLAGFRLASLLWFSLLVGGVTWIAGRAWGLKAGVAAGLALLLMPRLVGHAHIAATDMPLTLFWFTATAGFATYLIRGGLVPLALGAAGFGLAAGTKFTAYLLPLPLIAWALLYCREPKRWLAAAAALGVGFVLSLSLNPLTWHAPLAYVDTLVQESLGRSDTTPISTMYMGERYAFTLPWHHAPVLTAITIPLPLLALAIWGGSAGLRRRHRHWLIGLCGLQIGFFWLLLAYPSSPGHDGVRQFLPLFPFVALLAGRGFLALTELASNRLPAVIGRGWILGAAALVFLGPPFLQLTAAQPFYLSYYGETVGGARGAERLGMEATYWYDAVTPSFLEEINALLPQSSRLASFPSPDYVQHLQNLGLLRADIQVSDRLPAPYYLQLARKASFDSLQWSIYQNETPLRSVEYQDVRLVSLYRMDYVDSQGDSSGADGSSAVSDDGKGFGND